jgi:hypothetical protein
LAVVDFFIPKLSSKHWNNENREYRVDVIAQTSRQNAEARASIRPTSVLEVDTAASILHGVKIVQIIT